MICLLQVSVPVIDSGDCGEDCGEERGLRRTAEDCGGLQNISVMMIKVMQSFPLSVREGLQFRAVGKNLTMPGADIHLVSRHLVGILL